MEKVLLIEDDKTLALGIEYTLKKEGYKVNLVHNLESAFKAYNEEDFDLILLDLTLPDGSGYELCKEVRKKSLIPIIFLTACDEEANVVMGLDLGGDDYITKPIRIRELISRIKAVMRRNNQSKEYKEETIISGYVVINIVQNKVTIEGTEILLTPMEYRLLLILVKHQNQILSRNQILENLWDIQGEFVDDNTLSVYIRRLREKIEKEPAKPEYIVTVRGLGYKWRMVQGREIHEGVI